MRYNLPLDVYTAAQRRVAFIFDEFPTVVVSFSGGKDSTVILELALAEARKRDRLPLPVLWLDQECELQSTADYAKEVMYRPEVKPYWLQIPFFLLNATSHTEPWAHVWGPGEEWAREKDPISIKENTYGVDRFRGLLEKVVDVEFPGKVAVLTGMRAEESPMRTVAVTKYAAYKWITWSTGNRYRRDGSALIFQPIYDWSYRDVWKAIQDHQWPYNRHYDAMHRYGVPPMKMRVSNYHHETAVHALFMLQEIEPDTYAAATRRLPGLATAAHAGASDFFVSDLPPMFQDWREYRDFLLERLVTVDKDRDTFKRHFDTLDKRLEEGTLTRYLDDPSEALYRMEVNALIANDVEATKINQWALINGVRKAKEPADA